MEGDGSITDAHHRAEQAGRKFKDSGNSSQGGIVSRFYASCHAIDRGSSRHGVRCSLSGCATGSSDSPEAWSGKPDAAQATRSARDDALARLQKGMTADQVRAAWGEPARITPMDAPEGHAEVWKYVFSFAGAARQVQTGETTYTRPNPLTGVNETVSEPVYSTEQTVIEQTVELLFYEGALTEWKQSREAARSYN